MATAKKTPAKKTAVKNAKMNGALLNATGVKLPEGFKPVSAFASQWDYTARPVLEGVVSGPIRHITVGKGRNAREAQIMTIADDDGELHDVWDSASLKTFFEAAQPGQRVAIAYQGEREVGQPQPMKVFVGGFLEGDMDAPPAKAAGKKRVARRDNA